MRAALGGDAPDASPAKPSAPAAKAYEPRAADVVLMLSGKERGLLKPCGCFSPQRGGLARRAALWERVRAKAKASAAISLGGALSAGELRQNNVKAELLRATLSSMDYAGSLLTVEDLSPFVLSVSQPYDGPEQTPRPPLNVKLLSSGPLASSAAVDPILRFKVGDVPARAVSVVDPTAQSVLQTTWGVAEAVVPPDAALKALVKEPGILVVAAWVMREDIAMVVGAASGRADAVIVVDMVDQVASPAPVRGRAFGRPILVSFDEKCKEVGIVTLDKTDKGWLAGYDAVPLDPPYEEGSSKARAAVDALFADYRRRLKADGLLETFPSFDDHGPTWVGAEACKSCHAAIYDSWKATKHASAMKTLVEKDSSWDPECVRCHTVGWQRTLQGDWTRTRSAFQTPDKSPTLVGVQCENCHGAGSEHVQWPDRKDLFGARGDAGKIWREPGKKTCEVCHDVENSHAFQEEGAYEYVYLPQVNHGDVPREKRTVRPK